MMKKLFLFALAVGAVMFTACNNNAPTKVNEISQNFNKMKSHIGLRTDSARTLILNDGYTQVGQSNSYIKNVNNVNYTIFLEEKYGAIQQEKLTISASSSTAFISNDEDYMALLESLTAKFVLASKDTAYFQGFSCGSYGSSDFTDMVVGHRQAMATAMNSSAFWDKSYDYQGRNKNYVKVSRDFNQADRANGGKIEYIYRNEAVIPE